MSGAEVTAVIALGSNLGDRGELLVSAVAGLAAVDGIIVEAASPVVETIALKPGGRDSSAPKYLNAVVLVRTTLAPHALLDALHVIENVHGRERSELWGNRTLDLDIVDYDGQTLHDPDLVLPHPHAHERDFVLSPWAAVDPDAVLPGHGRVADLLTSLGDLSGAVGDIHLGIGAAR